MALKNFKSKSEAMRSLENAGYTYRFSLVKNGLRDINSNLVYPPGKISLVEYHLFPKRAIHRNVLIIYAFETYDGKKGLLKYSLDKHPDLLLARFLEKVKIKNVEV